MGMICAIPVSQYQDSIDLIMVKCLSSSHDDLRLSHRGSYGLVRQDLPSVEIDFILDYDVFSQHTDILHPHPSPNHAAANTGLVSRYNNNWPSLTPIL